MDKKQWDKWSTVEEYLKKKDVRLVVVCWVQLWFPACVHTVNDLTKAQKDCPFAKIFFINVAEEPEKAWELKIQTTPCVYFFWEGKPMTMRRPDWSDMEAFIGTASYDNWVDLIQFAKQTGDKGSLVLYADL